MPLTEGDEFVVTEPVDPAWIPGEPPATSGPETSSEYEDEFLEVDPSAEGTTPAGDPPGELRFDARQQQDFDGLMYIGRLRDSFTWQGHTFSIRTLTIDEMLEVGLLVKKYDGTIGSSKAYVAAVVAAAIESVDGRPLYQPLGPDESVLAKKFEHVKGNWYSWTIDEVYTKVMELENRVAEILGILGKLSG